MTFSTGTWGIQAKERSRRRHAYFRLKKSQVPVEVKRAWGRLHYAVKVGKIIRPTVCDHCGESKRLQAHHEDYSKPLEVTWLCGSCHRNIHK